MEQRTSSSAYARLTQYGVLRVTGEEARAFLHAQLTSDIERLAPGRAAFAGWCSAQGRLLASFVVLPQRDGFLLQLARELAAGVAKRLAMFVLRSKVKLADASGEWRQLGVWGEDATARLAAAGLEPPREVLGLAGHDAAVVARLGEEQFLVLAPDEAGAQLERRIGLPPASADGWMLREIRAGRALIGAATQDRFIPQMVGLDAIGGVSFSKGCYPGQEIVARAQYRGALKRRMYRVHANADLLPGQELYSDASPGQPAGTVVNAADGEALAVLQIPSVESRSPVRVASGGEPLELLPLPYSR